MYTVSNTWSNLDSDDNEDKQAKKLKQFESLRWLIKTMSETCLSWGRIANWSYEQEWRKERKEGFDPIVFYIGSSDMEDVGYNCGQCTRKHEV